MLALACLWGKRFLLLLFCILHAPIPTFPRLQGKELEVPALSPAAELGARGFTLSRLMVFSNLSSADDLYVYLSGKAPLRG